MPGDDRQQPGQRAGDVGRRRSRSYGRRRRAAGPGAPRVVVSVATFSVIRASSGAALTTSPPSSSRHTGAGARSAVLAGGQFAVGASRQPAIERRSGAGQLGGDRVEIVGVAGAARRDPQRQHRAAPEVEHVRARADRSCVRAARRGPSRPTGPASVGAARRPRSSSAACRRSRRPAEHQTAVEEVGDHPLGDQRRLADGHVTDQAGWASGARLAEHARAQPRRARGRSRSPRIAWCSAAWPSVSVSPGTGGDHCPTDS